MKKHSLNILGLSEFKWKKSGYCYFERYRFISVGGGKGENGVAIILDQEMARRVVFIEKENGDRLIKIEKEAKPRNLMIFQVNMPTTDSDDEEIEKMYEKIENLIKVKKEKMINIVREMKRHSSNILGLSEVKSRLLFRRISFYQRCWRKRRAWRSHYLRSRDG